MTYNPGDLFSVLLNSIVLALLFSPLLLLAYPFEQVNFFESDWRQIPPGDCLMILGSKVLKGNKPDLMMSERIATAKDVIDEHTDHIILSGGTVDDKKSEAEVMASLLKEDGIAEPKMILEQRSTSTYENFLFSQPLIAEVGCKKVDVLSHGFHLSRVSMVAERLGIPINRLIPAESSDPDSHQRLSREYLAFLWYWLAWGWVTS